MVDQAVSIMDKLLSHPASFYFVRMTSDNQPNIQFFDQTGDSLDFLEIKTQLLMQQYRVASQWKRDVEQVFKDFKRTCTSSTLMDVCYHISALFAKEFKNFGLCHQKQWVKAYNKLFVKLAKLYQDAPESLKYYMLIEAQGIQGIPKIYEWETEIPDYLYPERPNEPPERTRKYIITDDMNDYKKQIAASKQPSPQPSPPPLAIAQSPKPQTHKPSVTKQQIKKQTLRQQSSRIVIDLNKAEKDDLYKEQKKDREKRTSRSHDDLYVPSPPEKRSDVKRRKVVIDEYVYSPSEADTYASPTSTRVSETFDREYSIALFSKAVVQLYTAYDAQRMVQIILEYDDTFDYNDQIPEVDIQKLSSKTIIALLEYVKSRYHDLGMHFPREP